MESVKYNEKDYKIKIRHTRPTKRLGMNSVFSDKGGKTTAFITLNDTETISAEAVCSKLDNFSKKRGRLIAIGRLKKKINKRN